MEQLVSDGWLWFASTLSHVIPKLSWTCNMKEHLLAGADGVPFGTSRMVCRVQICVVAPRKRTQVLVMNSTVYDCLCRFMWHTKNQWCATPKRPGLSSFHDFIPMLLKSTLKSVVRCNPILLITQVIWLQVPVPDLTRSFPQSNPESSTCIYRTYTCIYKFSMVRYSIV